MVNVKVGGATAPPIRPPPFLCLNSFENKLKFCFYLTFINWNCVKFDCKKNSCFILYTNITNYRLLNVTTSVRNWLGVFFKHIVVFGVSSSHWEFRLRLLAGCYKGRSMLRSRDALSIAIYCYTILLSLVKLNYRF